MIRPNLLFTLASIAFLGFLFCTAADAQVFHADFETSTAANIGTINHSGGPAPVLVPVDGNASHTDWGANAVWWDRTSSSGGAAGFTAELLPTSTVDIVGAELSFDFVLRRTNTSGVKSHFVTAFDSGDNVVFSMMLIDRQDSGLANILDYTSNGELDERQRQTTAYVDATNGNSLFAATDIATGAIPDSNDRSGGSNSFTFFFGNDNRDAANVNEEEAGVFTINTTATGWTLDAKSYVADTSLTDFTTNELPFFTPGVTDIARVEITGQTVQAGGYWDNITLDGSFDDPLNLIVDRSTGAVTLENPNVAGVEFDFDYYEIKSAAGSLNPGGWTSLQDQNLPGFPAGNGTGDGWEEGGNNNSNQLIESYLLGSSILDGGESLSLGNAFQPGGTEDLVFAFLKEGAASPTFGTVEYIGVAGPACDITGDGSCDVADIRQLYDDIAAGTAGGPSDLDGNNVVNNDDIDDWLAAAGSFNEKTYLPGDSNLDGNVGGSDFTTLAASFGRTGLPEAHWENGNFNGNGSNGVFEVGGPDFTSLASNFGHTSVSAVPEPSSLTIVLASGIGLISLFRRRLH